MDNSLNNKLLRFHRALDMKDAQHRQWKISPVQIDTNRCHQLIGAKFLSESVHKDVCP